METRPKNVPISKYVFPNLGVLTTVIRSDIEDACYAAALSYSDALRSLDYGNSSWAIVKLYYSAFYSLRATLLMDGIIPFHCGSFYLCDIRDGTIKNGGRSSHQWKWNSIRDFKRLSNWLYSEDSATAYEKLRNLREDANYRFGFADPSWPDCLKEVSIAGLARSFRTYRDDSAFLYTYLDDHVALAYPTKLIMSLSEHQAFLNSRISSERKAHLKKVWPLKDKVPLL